LIRRDWLLTLLVVGFVAFNVSLWPLPISHVQLFLITLPVGIAFFAVFLWLVGRGT